MRFFLVFTCTGLTLAVVSCADRGITEPDPLYHQPFHVEGVVTSSVDGAPLSDVFIRLYDTECPDCTLTTGEIVEVTYGKTYSDELGYYELDGKGPCILFMKAKRVGYRESYKFYDCDETNADFDIVLTPESAAYQTVAAD